MSSYWIKNVRIIDGTGCPPFTGYIHIVQDKITDMGAGEIEAPLDATVVNGAGLTATPGFIDIHRHADYALFKNDFGEAELYQGLTTMINGNCGMCGAPLSGTLKEEVYRYQKPVIGTVPEGSKTNSLLEYFESIRVHSPALNVGTLSGFGTLAALLNGYSDPFPDTEMHLLYKAIEDDLSFGAFGISLGLGYAPAFMYPTDFIIRALEPLKHSGIPVTVHMRQEGDGMLDSIDECIEIARSLDTPLEISHLKAIGKKNWKNYIPEALSRMRHAWEDGVRIFWDLYPYTAGSTQLAHVLPPETDFSEAIDSIAAYHALEKRVANDSDFENIIHLCGYENIYPGHMNSLQWAPYSGLSLSEGAEKAGMEPLRFLLYLLRDENPAMVDFITCEEDICRALSDPDTVIISDSIYPGGNMLHPRVAGTFTRVIEKYVLREKILPIEDAVRKMTLLPAERMGIRDRGVLRKGKKADILLFDPSQLKEKAKYGCELANSEGMDIVFINGNPVIQNGTIINKHAGNVLLRGTGV